MEKAEKQSGDETTSKGSDKSTSEPGKRLLARLLQLIPKEVWQNLKAGDRVVFSSRPTEMQVLLPTGADEAITRYVRDWGAVQALIPLEAREQLREDPSLSRYAALFLNEMPANSKVILCIERAEDLEVHCKVLDGKGEELESTDQDLDLDTAKEFEGAASLDILNDKDLLKKVSANADPELKAIQRFYSSIPRTGYQPASPAESQPSWLNRALDPTRFEELGIAQGLYWEDIAGRLGLNLIATLSDEAQQNIIFLMGVKKPYLPLLVTGGLYKSAREENCLLIKPSDDAEDSSIDRTALKNMLSGAVEHAGLTIDLAGAYLASSPDPIAFKSWDRLLLERLLREDGQGGAGPLTHEVDGLRLYGTLSPEQRQLLRQTSLPFKNLSSATLQWLQQKAFGAPQRHEEEPTELLPNGLTPSGMIRIVEEKDRLVITAVNSSSGKPVSVSPATTAESLGRLFAGTSGGAAEQKQAVAAHAVRQYRLGYRHAFTIEVQYAPGFIDEFPLSETTYAPRAFATYEELPLDFRQAVEKARVARVEEVKRIQEEMADPPDSTPPPN